MVLNTTTNKHHPDLILLAVTGAMLLLGVLIISSASALMSQMRFGDSLCLFATSSAIRNFTGFNFRFGDLFSPVEFFSKGVVVFYGGGAYIIDNDFCSGYRFYGGWGTSLDKFGIYYYSTGGNFKISLYYLFG